MRQMYNIHQVFCVCVMRQSSATAHSLQSDTGYLNIQTTTVCCTPLTLERLKILLPVSHTMQSNEPVMFLLLLLNLLPIFPLPQFRQLIRAISLLRLQTLLCNDLGFQFRGSFSQLDWVTANIFPVHFLPTLEEIIRCRKTNKPISL